MIDHDPRQIDIEDWLRQLDAPVADSSPSKTSAQQKPSHGKDEEKDWRTRQDSNL